jgi:hypothetical protein
MSRDGGGRAATRDEIVRVAAAEVAVAGGARKMPAPWPGRAWKLRRRRPWEWWVSCGHRSP